MRPKFRLRGGEVRTSEGNNKLGIGNLGTSEGNNKVGIGNFTSQNVRILKFRD